MHLLKNNNNNNNNSYPINIRILTNSERRLMVQNYGLWSSD
jgi:hypothetical protein